MNAITNFICDPVDYLERKLMEHVDFRFSEDCLEDENAKKLFQNHIGQLFTCSDCEKWTLDPLLCTTCDKDKRYCNQCHYKKNCKSKPKSAIDFKNE